MQRGERPARGRPSVGCYTWVGEEWLSGREFEGLRGGGRGEFDQEKPLRAQPRGGDGQPGPDSSDPLASGATAGGNWSGTAISGEKSTFHISNSKGLPV